MIVIIVLIVSVCLGSFANNLISFYCGTSKFDFSRSTCLCGKRTLNGYELIPIVSFIIQKGKCKGCTEKITLRYPMVEVICGITGILCWLKYGISPFSFFHFLLFYTLLIIALVDLYTFRIPNHLVVFLLLLAGVKFLAFDDLMLLNFIPAVLITFFFLVINRIYLRTKGKAAIGVGDIKLIAVLMLMINIPFSLLGLWFSSFLALPGYFLLKRAFPSRNFHSGKLPFGFFIWLGYGSIIFIS